MELHFNEKIFFFLLLFFIFISNALSSEISVVDITFLLKNSNKGKAIQKDLENLKNKNLKEFSSKKKKLEEKEKKIASKKNVLSEQDFKKEVLEFRKEVESFNIERNNSTLEINKIRQKKTAKLLDEINKILIQYSSKNSISTIIDKKNVIITKEETDITKDILKILNK